MVIAVLRGDEMESKSGNQSAKNAKNAK